MKFSSKFLKLIGFSVEIQKIIDNECVPNSAVKSSLFRRYDSRNKRLMRFRSTAFLKYLFETETPTF